jgi:hypothetical protein
MKNVLRSFAIHVATPVALFVDAPRQAIDPQRIADNEQKNPEMGYWFGPYPGVAQS